MKKNEPPLLPQALNQLIPNSGMSRKWKFVLAFLIGASLVFMTFFLAWAAAAVFVGGGVGEAAIFIFVPFIGLGVWFFITQYCLSCGNPQALRNDWPFIIAMNSVPFGAAIIALAFANKMLGVIMLVVAIITLACSYAGVGLAALTARRRSH